MPSCTDLRLFVVGASIGRLRSHILAARAGQDDEVVLSAMT